MKVHYDLDKLPAFNNAVITIGSFDGVHLGHQELLHRINRLARRTGGESVVITFHPHPRSIIYPQDDKLSLLSTIEEKISLIGRYAVDHLVIAPFSVAFSQLSADEYIHKFIVGRFHPRYVVIGYDHRFGLNRMGDINYLEWHGRSLGYEVIQIEKQVIDDLSVSSTKIRKAVEEGDIAAANRLLGHPYTLMAKVVYGRQLGTKMGFPTANLQSGTANKLIPRDGIYAVRVKHEGNQYEGMLYIGQRPTIKDDNHRSVEVNIFDFDEYIYGQTLEVEFVEFIRPDATFESVEALQQQLSADREQARARLSAASLASPPVQRARKTAVVILNFNGIDYLRQYLPSVVAHVEPDTTVYLADNASTDGSVDWVRKHQPGVHVIALTQNYGFAEGYNQALKTLDADTYVLLNSDVAVQQGWMRPCLQRLWSAPEVAAVQPKILSLSQPGKFEYAGAAGGWIDMLGYPFCRGRIFSDLEDDRGQYDTAEEIFWASGAALFIKADLFHGLGGFDGDYFAHSEEIDLCWRLKRAGFEIWVEPGSSVFHLGGGTLDYLSARKAYLNFRNTLLTVYKNAPIYMLIWWLPLRLLLDGLAGGLFLFQGKWKHISAIISAHWYFFPRAAYWWRKRHHYNRLIAAASLRPGRSNAGIYYGSIVWQYFALGKTHFSDIAFWKK